MLKPFASKKSALERTGEPARRAGRRRPRASSRASARRSRAAARAGRRSRRARGAGRRGRAARTSVRSVAPTASAPAPPAGPGDRAERRAGAAVVPGRRDDERVQVERALHGTRLRAVRERGVRLRDTDERDAHRVVRVAVAVRVDRTVEPGDQLVAARVDDLACPSAAGCQPAMRIGSTVASGATPCSPPGPPAPTRIPASSVPWRSTCDGSSGFERAVASSWWSTRSIPGQDLARAGTDAPGRRPCRAARS